MSRNFNFTPFSYGSGNKPNNPNNHQKTTGFNAVPPPAALNASRLLGNRPKTSYQPVDAIPQVNPANYGSRKRSTVHLDEDDYFDDDDQNDSSKNLEYIPAADSPAANNDEDSDDEEDPLDAFMAGLENEQKKEKEIKEKFPQISSQSINKGVRADIDDMDDEESYYKYMEDNPMAGVADENSEDEMEYDQDGNPIVSKKRIIDPLPPVDHSQIEYVPFEKNFYQPHEEISKMNKVQKDELRHKLGIKVMGAAVSAPVCSFAHFGFDEQLMKVIRKSEYVSPTPIQAQAIPAALSGRDLIGIAKTGSGKFFHRFV